MSIMKALRDYFLTCPLMDGSRINVDYLPERGIEYSIDSTPVTAVIKRYTGGASLRQYVFTISSVMDYGSDTLQNIANSALYEDLADWMEEQTLAQELPELSEGLRPISIEAQSTGYLFTTSPSAGRYQIQCRLVYYKER